jgi:hypothetical protein
LIASLRRAITPFDSVKVVGVESTVRAFFDRRRLAAAADIPVFRRRNGSLSITGPRR